MSHSALMDRMSYLCELSIKFDLSGPALLQSLLFPMGDMLPALEIITLWDLGPN